MLQKGLDILVGFFRFLLPLVYLYFGFLFLFFGMCLVWYLIFRYRDGMRWIPSGQRRIRKKSMFLQLLIDVPRRYVLDRLQREPGYFYPRGIHMFCGEQGCGKTIACVEMMLRFQKMYPKAKMITNFGVTSENDELVKWQQLLDYTNEKKGVIVGIDEIQNWFMSGKNQLPEGMLEVATQNRKNRRLILGTSQRFNRVAKGVREQTTWNYECHRPILMLIYSYRVMDGANYDDNGKYIVEDENDKPRRHFYIPKVSVMRMYNTLEVVRRAEPEPKKIERKGKYHGRYCK